MRDILTVGELIEILQKYDVSYQVWKENASYGMDFPVFKDDLFLIDRAEKKIVLT